MEARISGEGGWTDPKSSPGTYQLLSTTAGSYTSGSRTTANGQYTDKFDFKYSVHLGGNSTGLRGRVTGGCRIDACSQSQSTSYYDYSTNYCNMYNLFCATKDGCKIVNTDLTWSEDSAGIFECSFDDKSDCTR